MRLAKVGSLIPIAYLLRRLIAILVLFSSNVPLVNRFDERHCVATSMRTSAWPFFYPRWHRAAAGDNYWSQLSRIVAPLVPEQSAALTAASAGRLKADVRSRRSVHGVLDRQEVGAA